MEALTRLVADSLARHGFDRPVDPRRLQWSRWSRCDSPHSLLIVPSKPGIFAIAEEIMDLGNAHIGTAAQACPERAERAEWGRPAEQSSAAFTSGTDAVVSKRMLAVLQFSEDDDMAFTLDRMFTRINPMRSRLASGRCFLRYVVIADQDQRRSICAALNQWMLSSAEKASGFTADFSSTLEVATARVGAGDSPAQIRTAAQSLAAATPNLDSGAAKNLHCSQSFPSGF